MSWAELPPTLLKHKKLWAAVGGVFASVCAAAHKPMGNHRAHTTPSPYFSRGQENSQSSRAGTEMMQELEKGAHCWLHLTDSCQMPAADGFRCTWISLLAGKPSLLLSTDTKSVWEINHRKTINENQEMCSEHYSLTMLCPSLRGPPNKRHTNTSPNICCDNKYCHNFIDNK